MKCSEIVAGCFLLLFLSAQVSLHATTDLDSIPDFPNSDFQSCPIMADAGPDITMCACTTATLNGSFTGTGGNITINWTAIPASGNAWLSNAHILNPTITASCTFSGVMLFQLEVISSNPFCTSTDVVAVTVLDGPDPGVNVITQATCNQGGAFNLIVSGGVGPFTYLWNTGYTGTTPSNLPPGQYTVTVTDSQGCTRAGSWPIGGTFPITPMINNPTICGSGGSAVLTVTGGTFAGYAWSSGQTGNPITISSPGTYTVTITAANGCTVTAESVVTAIPSPTPELNMPMLCTGMTVPLIASGGNFTLVHWSNGQNGSAINISVGGTYTVTVTESTGCTATASQTISALPSPSPVINGPPNFCNGGSATLTAGGGTFAGINWSTGENTAAINVTTPGTYTVTVTASNGCSATATKIISVLPLVTASINGPVNLCLGGAAILTIGGGVFPLVNWSTGETGNSININAPGTYDVTVTAANGCTGTASRTIATLPGPLPVISGPSSVCEGQNAALLVTGGSFSTVSWSTGQNGNSIVVNSTGIYMVTVSSSNGCTATDLLSVTVAPKPVPVVSGPPSFCQGENATLMVTSGPYAFYAWSVGGSDDFIDINSSGTYTVTVTDISGCTGSAAYNVSSLTAPSPVVSGPASLCSNGAGTLVLGNGNFTSPIWSTGQTTNSVNITGPGVFTVTVTGTNGCTGSTTWVVTSFPVPNPSIVGTGIICAGAITTLAVNGGSFDAFNWSTGQSTPSIAVNETGDYTVTVTDSNGCTGTSSGLISIDTLAPPSISGNPTLCSGGGSASLSVGAYQQILWSNGANTPSVVVGNAGIYAVTVTDLVGCTATNSMEVLSQPSPVPQISGPSVICAGNNALLDAGAGYFGYQWSGGETTSSIQAFASGVYWVTVTAANGCTGIDSFALNVLPQLVANAGIDQTVCPNSFLSLSASGGLNYLWNTGETTTNITIQPTISTTYTVTVTAVDACSASDEVDVKVLPVTSSILNQVLCPGENLTVAGEVFDVAHPNGTVVFTGTNGCDSLLNVQVTFHPVIIQNITAQTCNPALAGTFTQVLQSQFGCDSTVITQVVFNPNAVDTTLLKANTCDPALAGVSSFLLQGIDGCDSVIILTTLLHPSPVLMLEKITCNPALAGSSTQIFQTPFGCDSTVITNTVFDPNAVDTTFLVAHTCDPVLAGISFTLLNGLDGCDSLVILITILHTSPTIVIQKYTCNPALAGTSTQIFQTPFGCDSTIITNTIFNPNAVDTTLLVAHTCDPALAGISSTLFIVTDGCDSLVIVSTILHPSPTVVLEQYTCDPGQAGTSTQVFPTPFGCDSTVVMHTIFNAAADTSFILAYTCDPAQSGVVFTLLMGVNGCDSVVVTNTVLLPADTVFVQQTTCDPAAAGVFTDTFTNAAGCDSIVVSVITYDPLACNHLKAQIEGIGVSCFGLDDGKIAITILSGVPPFVYSWSNINSGVSGSGSLTGINQTATITGLKGGDYNITISMVMPPSDTVTVFKVTVPFALDVNAYITTDYHGFSVSCAGALNGAAGIDVTGGTPPIAVKWSDGTTDATINGLGAGWIGVAIQDANGCTRTDSVLLNEPPPLIFITQQTAEKCAGDNNGTIQANWVSGGILPVLYALNGDVFETTNSWTDLSPGAYHVQLKDAEGCLSADMPVQIQQGHAFSFKAGLDTVLLSGDSLLLTVASSHPIDTMVWTPTQSVHIVAPQQVKVFPLVSTDYQVVATDSLGCMAWDRLLVRVDHRRHLYTPNVICPDCPDGQNGVFTIFAGDGIKSVDVLRVFDRWGDMVFENLNFPVNDPSFGWNGIHPRTPKSGNTGVYVYYAVIRLTDDTTIVLKGDVTVVR